MNIINDFINFLADKSLTLSKKTILIVSIVFILIVVDLLFGFSFNYSLNQRLNQIEKIEQIRLNYNLTDTNEQQLKKIEDKIINKKDYLYFLLWQFQNVVKQETTTPNDSTFTIAEKPDSTFIPQPSKIQIETEKVLKRKFFLDLLSSSYILLLLLIILPFVPLFQKENTADSYIGVLIIMIVIIGFTIVNYYLYSLIPTICRPWVNYLINVVLHFGIVYSIIKLITRSSKKK
jgi:hypothetical protein